MEKTLQEMHLSPKIARGGGGKRRKWTERCGGKKMPRRGASQDGGEVYGEACQGPVTVRFCERPHFYQAYHGSGGHGHNGGWPVGAHWLWPGKKKIPSHPELQGTSQLGSIYGVRRPVQSKVLSTPVNEWKSEQSP